MKRKLPIGQSNFEYIVKNNNLYVDKTSYIYNLITSTQFNFLSRPRRFGKSLLISTLEQVFKGNREIFNGLWIAKSDYDWNEYSIIRLDMNSVDADSPETLKRSLSIFMDTTAREYGIDLQIDLLKMKFEEMVVKIYNKTKRSIVVLIDEYDKPIISHLGRGDDHLKIAIENRQVLKDFYGTLKAASVIEKLRFVLLTGVSKFSKTGVFSELNNLFDLTMDSNYSAMLGITDEE
ncbi:MAG: AAA family ATPase, partial [Calditerrivibrio sp.]|nr:AAA family ATPase [Calditerrivibrio sp.]